MKNDTYLQQLAAFTSGLRLCDLPPEVVEKVRLCVFDALECCLLPMTDRRGEAALASIRTDRGGCALFGTGLGADAADAAFYNTVKGAITSRNDTCLEAGCHPGSVLIPTVFALAQENGASGEQVLLALYAGYETMIRFGMALRGRASRAWRATALSAPVGAAFAAARIEGLNGEQTASAASFACHMCGGVNEWAVSGTGEDVFQNGWGARNGVLCARLAKGGADGCKTVVEGASGLLAALGAPVSGLEGSLAGLGREHRILRVIHKPINSCLMVQTPSQAAAELVARHPDLKLGEIERVKIEVTRSAKEYPGCANNQRIDTLVQGIMSIALGVSSTLAEGNCDNINWAPPIRPEILELMHRCEVAEDKAFTEAGKGSARVTVIKKDGQAYSAEKPGLTPLTPQEVRMRFRRTCRAQLGEKQAQQLEEQVENLERLPSIQTIAELLA